LKTTNFTPEAQQCLVLAREEAARSKQEFVSTDHLLLALLTPNGGLVLKILQHFGLDADALRLEIEKRTVPGIGSGKLEDVFKAPRFKKAIALAAKEAKALHRPFIGNEHLLLGLLRERDGMAGQLLKHFNLDMVQLREEIQKQFPLFRSHK
jgi:ATP-dependent Clp protease ATP-binding subunit ClpC